MGASLCPWGTRTAPSLPQCEHACLAGREPHWREERWPPALSLPWLPGLALAWAQGLLQAFVQTGLNSLSL